MKKIRSVMLAKLNLVKLAVLAIVLCALVTGLRLPRLQGQNDAAGAAPPSAPPSAPPTGVTSSKLNPFQIALLHWENTNQTTSFGVGATPGWAAFDGVARLHPRRERFYCSFAYSAFASFRMGMSGSASFQSVRKSL